MPLRSEDDLQEISPLPYDLGTQVAEHLAGTQLPSQLSGSHYVAVAVPELGVLQFTSLPLEAGMAGVRPKPG